MAARTFIPVEEYLTTVYRPSCDYVDGRVLERNFGERDHSYVQAALGSYFLVRRKDWSIKVYSELRLEVRPGRFRVADISVDLCSTDQRTPFLCVEFQSAEDRASAFLGRIDD